MFWVTVIYECLSIKTAALSHRKTGLLKILFRTIILHLFVFSSFLPLISTFHLSLILPLGHTLGLIKPVINILSCMLFFWINKNAEAKIAILLAMMCFWQFEKVHCCSSLVLFYVVAVLHFGLNECEVVC